MSKRKRVLLMLARGGHSQADVAAIVGCSKRDVSECARYLRTCGLGVGELEAMSEADAAALFARPPRKRDESHLQIDARALVERKSKNPRLPLKLMWAEHCEAAAAAHKLPYSYSQFCEIFSEAAKSAGATAHFAHEAGQKVYVDWAGDVAWLTDRVTGRRTKVYVLVLCLPRSGWIWAGGYTDMSMRSWLDGHARTFEAIGGVPHVLVPDNCATATDRTGSGVTRINDTYRRFAEHYGCGILPARVRRPRDKSLAEGTVNIVEQWAIAPSHELCFRDLDEFNDYLDDRIAWLNAREMPDHGASRDERLLEELPHLLPLPSSRYELCDWRRAKVAPDYHVRVDYMHYSVPFALVGRTVDVGVTDRVVRVMDGGEVVAVHDRLRGRKGQYSTNDEHMPPAHRDARSPWSRERFESWADRVGPATGECIRRVLGSRPVVEQAFVPCRNILGLSKSRSPELLERACARYAAGPAVPSYTALKDTIAAIRAEDAEARAALRHADARDGALVDRAKSAGHTRGADAWKRGE